MKKRKRLVAYLTAAVLLVSTLTLSGCGENLIELIDQVQIDNGGVGSAWINSDIVGAIDKNTQVSVKDDFYTAVNKEWILSQELDETGQVIDLFRPQKTVNQQMVTLINDAESTGYRSNNTVGMDSDEIKHVGELVEHFVSIASDEDTRNSLGVEPLRPFIEDIENITDINDFTDFILDINGRNALGAPFTEFAVERTNADPDHYYMKIYPMNFGNLILKQPYLYRACNAEAIKDKEVYSELVRYVLEKLGYTRAEANAVIRKSLRFEMRLAQKMASDTARSMSDYESEKCELMQLEGVSELLGDYPIQKILSAYGLDAAEQYIICEPDYMQKLSNLYSQARLEEIKSYYIVHTVILCADLLDVETKDEIYSIINRTDQIVETEDPLTALKESEEEKAAKALYDEYISQYIPAPFEMLYIAAYCSGEQKDVLCSMVKEIKASFREIILSEDWLSEQARENCVEKLDNMAERILFPDSYVSYKGLDLSRDDTLIEMVRDINAYEIRVMASQIGKEIDRDVWDLKLAPTTTVNAVNAVNENAIYIFAGICSGNVLFDPDAPYEVNLAKLGTTIGHEMTHGFDSSGYRIDKYGRNEDFDQAETLMSSLDRSVFTKKIFSLSTWYGAISPMPGENNYVANVAPEAIADMGGMRCALRVAKGIKGFDYDLFFRSYAENWRKVCTEEMEKIYARADVHPLAYLRCNVTVQQFDEFFDTYGISKGDGMYIEPENRICLW